MICSSNIFFINNPDRGPKLRLKPYPDLEKTLPDPQHCLEVMIPRWWIHRGVFLDFFPSWLPMMNTPGSHNSPQDKHQESRIPAYEHTGVSPWIDPGYSHLPQSKIIMYSFKGVLLSCEKIKISSSAPGLCVMTLHKCRVDCPFSDHVIRLFATTLESPWN